VEKVAKAKVKGKKEAKLWGGIFYVLIFDQ